MASTLGEWTRCSSDGVGRPSSRLARRAEALIRRWETDYSAYPAALEQFLWAAGIRDLDHARVVLSRTPSMPEEVEQAIDFLQKASRHRSPVAEKPEVASEFVLQPLLREARTRAEAPLNGRVDHELIAILRTTMAVPPPGVAELVIGPIKLLEHLLERDPTCDTDSLGWLRASQQNWLRFFEFFPTLGRLLSEMLARWIRQSVTLAERLYEDRPILLEWLDIGALDVLGVQGGLGDPHSGGASTHKILLGTGRAFIYKPRPVNNVSLLAELNAHLPESYRFGIANTLDRAEYGWTHWVEHAACAELAGIERYYQRLGALAAVAWSVGSKDLHGYNIVANGDRPVVIDHETLLSPALKSSSESGDWILAESPLASGILPYWGPAQKFSASAYGGEVPRPASSSEPLSEVEVGHVQPSPVGSRLSVPYLASRGDIRPMDYANDFRRGFDVGLSSLRANEPPANDQLCDLYVRVVLRPTHDYMRLLADGKHPDLLRDHLVREGHFNSLRIASSPAMSEAGIVASEIEDLREGDVPLFWARASSTDLSSSRGKTARSFLERAPLAEMNRRWDAATNGREWGTWIVDSALGVVAVGQDPELTEGRCCDDFQAEPPVIPGAIKSATEMVAERLIRLSRKHPRRDDIAWVDVVGAGDGRTWDLRPCDMSLYRGTLGIAVFLAAFACMGQHKEVEAFTRRVVEGWIDRDERGNPSYFGAYEGAAGDLYGLFVLNSFIPQARTSRVIEDKLAFLCSASPPGDKLDVFRGAAGTLLCLLRLMVLVPPKYRRAAEQAAYSIGELLIQRSVRKGQGRAWPTFENVCTLGFAHGSTGIALAVRELANRTNQRSFRQLAEAADSWEESQLTSDGRAWRDLRPLVQKPGKESWTTSWCNGSSGIGLARLLSASADSLMLGTYTNDIQRALDLATHHGLGRGHTLCDGDMGQVELLRLAGQVLVEPRLTEEASSVAGMISQSIATREGAVSSGYGFLSDLPGLMTGLAGVGIGLLREFERERVPSPLILAPPLTGTFD